MIRFIAFGDEGGDEVGCGKQQQVRASSYGLQTWLAMRSRSLSMTWKEEGDAPIPSAETKTTSSQTAAPSCDMNIKGAKVGVSSHFVLQPSQHAAHYCPQARRCLDSSSRGHRVQVGMRRGRQEIYNCAQGTSRGRQRTMTRILVQGHSMLL